MSILPIVVEILKFLKNVNENIQCVYGYAYSSGKQKMCTRVNEDSWGMMKNFFPDAKPIKKCPKTFLCKECTYVQKDITKMMRKLIPQKILNLPFYHHIFWKTLFLMCKLLKKV